MKTKRTVSRFDIFNILFLAFLSLLFLVPFWIVFSTSFVGQMESVRRGAYLFYPEVIDLSSYKTLLTGGSVVYRAYLVTLFRVVVGTLLNLLFTITLAYGMSKRNMPGRGIISVYVLFTMLFSGGLIPTFMLISALKLINTIWVLIIPSLVSAWNTLLMRNFFMQIPESLEESAHIDGASVLNTLFRITLPLSKASIATIGLFYAVAHWNRWFDAAIYIHNTELYPMQLLLRNIVLSASNQNLNSELMSEMIRPPAESLKSAAIIITTLPILTVYPFVQKYFVKGVLVGGLKG
jgi:putative aldouronate transport system permease protein